MATAAGAQVLGRAHEMGRLASGYLADFVVFDFRHAHLTPLLDPLGTLVHDAGGRDVEHVFVDGKQVIQRAADDGRRRPHPRRRTARRGGSLGACLR